MGGGSQRNEYYRGISGSQLPLLKISCYFSGFYDVCHICQHFSMNICVVFFLSLSSLHSFKPRDAWPTACRGQGGGGGVAGQGSNPASVESPNLFL